MRENEMDRDIAPDPVLGAALRWAGGTAPVDEVDWDGLRSNIRDRAALPLARRRVGRRAGGWLRPLIPLAAAAGVAMAVWVGGVGRAGPEAATEEAGLSVARVTAEQVLLEDLSEREFHLLVTERGNPDDLLLIAASN